jgi:4-hydroxybenzoate polyprenyltransferase
MILETAVIGVFSDVVAFFETPQDRVGEASVMKTQDATLVDMQARLADLFALCRPQQWSKNVFVLAPLLFSGRFQDKQAVAAELIALAAFCFGSSAVYAFNDVIDAPADRHHPRKQNRPVASGRVDPLLAVFTAIAMLAGVGVLSSILPPTFWLFIGFYLVNSLLYCVWLKHKVILDVMVIGIGFVLRLVAGCAVIDVKPSPWMIICGFALALVLGFGKRRTEVQKVDKKSEYRFSLKSYDVDKLNTLLAVSVTVCLLSYMLYTIAPQTVQMHHTPNLIYTVPFVAYGLFRYLFKAQEGKGDGPTDILFRDRVFLVVGLLWGASVVLILHFS